MGMHSKWIGGALAFYDDSEPQRLLDAFGPDICKFIEDFVNTPFASANNMAAWTTTLVGASTVANVAGATGGSIILTTGGTEDDGPSIQLKGEAFKLASGKECYFGCRITPSEATQCDFLAGLCITDTALLGGMTDGVYFRKVDESTTMNFVLEKGNAETATAYGSAIVGGTVYTLEWYFDGTNMDWYVNGVLQTRPVVTNLPDTEWLTPSFELLNGATAAGKTLTIDWVRVIQNNE